VRHTPATSVPVTLVIDLDEIRSADAGRVGATMARLGELRARGWRVPDGYAVTARALADPDSPALRDAIAQAHERLRHRTGRVGHGALKVAVRSSAVSEDGDRASFAGQYETYLGIVGIDDVLRYIRKCRASGGAARALTYRERFGAASRAGTADTGSGDTGSGDTTSDLAVGVLELVDARSAGVVFTLDPVSGDRGTLVIEANWGLGESVVSGQVTPDHWAVDAGTGEIREHRAGAKEKWTVFSPAAGKVTTEPLPPDLAARPCLAEHEVRYLCDRAREIAARAGSPQDIEWAIARDAPFPENVFFLQHRPETSWAQGAAPGTPEKGFDPVQYALRNVFKVPGT
jgi:pyruvate,water dikinase